MGNSRVFEYAEIARIYGEMNTITGDSSDPTSIAGLLHKINEEYTEVVNGTAGEDELALKGDAASDLKNSWDNTVSDHFTKFVENFGAWSSAVAASAGDYTQFEQAVQGIKSANPLGWNSGGATDTASATGFYSNALSEQDIADLAAQAQFYQLTGATYVDTGMVAYAEKKKVWNVVNTVLAVGSIVSSGATMFSMLKTAGLLAPAATTALVPVATTTALVPAGAAAASGAIPTVTVSLARMGWNILGGGAASWALAHGIAPAGALALGIAAGSSGYVSAAAGAAGGVVGWLNPDYDPAKYMTGTLDVPVAVGEAKTINGADYTFVGSSAGGTNIYYDSNKNMVYEDANGNLQPVTDATGQPAMYVAGGNTVINAGSEVIGPQSTLKPDYVQVQKGEEYGDYFDTLDNLNGETTEWLNQYNAAQTPGTVVNQPTPGTTGQATPGTVATVPTTPGTTPGTVVGTNPNTQGVVI